MLDKDKIISNVKLIKGIADDLQDDLLSVLVDESEARILAYINRQRANRLEDLPVEVGYVVQDVTVMRFNKLNAEGARIESEEGRSYTWQDSYLDEHADALKSYHDADTDQPRSGRLFYY